MPERAGTLSRRSEGVPAVQRIRRFYECVRGIGVMGQGLGLAAFFGGPRQC